MKRKQHDTLYVVEAYLDGELCAVCGVFPRKNDATWDATQRNKEERNTPKGFMKCVYAVSRFHRDTIINKKI